MKRFAAVIFVLVLMGAGVNAQEEHKCPVDGLYESIANRGFVDGEQAIFTPWIRIGVDSRRGIVYWLGDSNDNGTLEDDELYSYRARFYHDGIQFMDGETTSFFMYYVDSRKYKLISFIGVTMYMIEFNRLEVW